MAAWPLEIEPPAARGRRWRWRRSTTRGSRRCRARSTWRRSRLQKPKLALATACGHGHVPGVRGVPGVPGVRAAAASAVPRCLGGPAAERATFLHTRRSKSACDSSCTRSLASRSTTRRTRRPRRPRRHGLPSKRGPITREARSPRRGLVRRGLVRRGLVRWGLVRRGLVQRGLVQRGLVRRGPAAAQRAGRPERPGPLCRGGPEDL